MKKRIPLTRCYKPGAPFIKTLDNMNPNIDLIDYTARFFLKQVDYNKQYINSILFPLYRREIKFSNGASFQVVQRITEIQRISGMKISELGDMIRTYIGEDIDFMHNGKPIPSDKILAAYYGIRNTLPVYRIKKILYT